MPTFRYGGLADNSVYDVSVSNGGAATRLQGLKGTAPNTSAIVINMRRDPDQIAPDGVFLNLAVTGHIAGIPPSALNYGDLEQFDPVQHYIRYETNWGDGADTFQFVKNLPAVWNDRNNTLGAQVSHVYRSPGTFTITVTAINEFTGETISTTTSVTVKDPAVEYAGTQTIFVDPSGQYTNKPTGAQEALSVGIALTQASNGTGPHRIMIADGAVLTQPSRIINNSIPPILICAEPGAAVRPQLNWNDGAMFSMDPIAVDLRVKYQGFDSNGPYDTTTETGVPDAVFYQEGGDGQAIGAQNTYLLMDQMQFSGYEDACISRSADHGDVTRIVYDTRVTNWRNFALGCFSQSADRTYIGKYIAMTGCAFDQDVDALVGTGDKITKNTHGPVRIADGDIIACNQCDMFSRTSWSPAAAQYQIVQSCLRLGSRGKVGTRCSVTQTVLEGGQAVVNFGVATPGDDNGDTENMRMESCIVLGSTQTENLTQFSSGGQTITNCLLIQPARASLATTEGVKAFAFTNGVFAAQSPGGRQSPWFGYNNTWVNLTTTSSAQFTQDGGAYTFQQSNSIYHQPNAGADANMATTQIAGSNGQAFLTPRYKGFTDENTPTPPAGSETPLDSFRLYTPLAAGDIGTATTAPNDRLGARVTYKDMFGNLRGSAPDKGCVQT